MKRLAPLFVLFVACDGADPVAPPRDGGARDAGAARDAGRWDGGPRDGGLPDGGLPDGGDRDAGLTDLVITVLLDGAPIEGAIVKQGGAERQWTTGPDGTVVVDLDPDAHGQLGVAASHPDARTRGAHLDALVGRVTIELERFDRSDNPEYPFADPGEPTRRDTTGQCAHCHPTLNEDWFASPHRTSAKNPRVHDFYAGTAAAFDSEAACTTAGGLWREGVAPGTGAAAFRCYVGTGALQAVNPACTEPPCETTATAYAECADCHAPAMDGVLGGRDLLDASGFAYDYGVHCDACHHVEDVDLAAAPGVAGRLKILRPSEPAPVTLGGGGFLPLVFGPSLDVPNPRMGNVPRAHFREASLCAGCHEHKGPPMRSGDTLDPARWPDGTLPFASTYSEWSAGPMYPSTPCQACHMPPAADRMNGADLQNLDDGVIGIAGGWRRPPGEVRRHSWYGPRQPEARMLELAAAVFVSSTVNGNVLDAEVTVKNVGAGHALPTGEAMRSVVLAVEAHCGATPLDATGGDAIPDFGGALATQASTGDWNRWPGAQVGDVVRIVARPGGHYDYDGPLTFNRGTRSAAERGLPIENVVGSRRIETVAPNGDVTFDAPLPAGDVAHRVRGPERPTDGTEAALLAGAPGFAFMRVYVDRDGRRAVPHFLAVDIASDNRLMPQRSHTTSHRFATTCADPVVTARLYYRAYPHAIARARGWPNPDQRMVEVRR
ncbi:MAG: hypothetical protein RIT81_14285 [Deltaproteobacteria bacterium]